ncbi:hypothetical protein Tco_0577861 [Tanacetum coccineum]
MRKARKTLVKILTHPTKDPNILLLPQESLISNTIGGLSSLETSGVQRKQGSGGSSKHLLSRSRTRRVADARLVQNVPPNPGWIGTELVRLFGPKKSAMGLHQAVANCIEHCQAVGLNPDASWFKTIILAGVARVCQE